MKSLITRRTLLRSPLLMSGSAGAGCSRRPSRVLSMVMDREKSDDLAILTYGLEAFTSSQNYLGRLVLEEFVGILTTSPDARNIAWTPRSAVVPSQGRILSGIILKSPIERIVLNQYIGTPGCALAVSSDLRRIVFPVVNPRGAWRLLMLDPKGSEVQQDLTKLTGSVQLAEVERVGISSNGARLALGTRTRVFVSDVSTSQRVFEASGRFPALSPDGRRLAFVDQAHNLRVRELDAGTEITIPAMSAYGVGTWSPDGALLLVGAWVSFSWKKRLCVVDTAGMESAPLMSLAEGDFGDRCFWINRRLLSS